MRRRHFLASLPLSAWLLLTHRPGFGLPESSYTDVDESSGPQSSVREPLLRRLELATVADLAVLEKFYGERLGLPVLERTVDQLTIQGGETRIIFYPAPAEHANPFYHFAFNIPENKIEEAHRWQLERTPLERPAANLRDPDLAPEITFFRNWNARSVFFWDPAGNLVEYIARHTLANASEGAFSSRDLLCVSEIGLVTDDTRALAEQLMNAFELDAYGSGSDAFRAVGDELGLLLVMIRGRRMGWVNPRPVGVSPVRAELRVPRATRLEPAGHPFRLSSE